MPLLLADFISCAEHLIDLNRTSPALLAASGRSAGGLLMGTVANVAGSYFQAMLVGMPFVDVINTMIGTLWLRIYNIVYALPARSKHSADGNRVGGMGQPVGERRSLRIHEVVLALRQRGGTALPPHVSHQRTLRPTSAGHVFLFSYLLLSVVKYRQRANSSLRLFGTDLVTLL